MTSVTRMICRLLIVAIAMLPFQTVHAGMIGTDQLASTISAQADRAAVLSIMGRTDVSRDLQALGVDLQAAKARVAAMSDQEVSALAGKLESLPAGAKGSAWGWAVVIAIVIWMFYRAR